MSELFSRFLLLTFFLAFSANAATVQQTFTGKVVGVKDGDTIEVMYQGKGLVVRLAGIDCPEKGQPYGNAAKQFSSSLCFGKNVEVKGSSKDRYGRTIAEVFIDGRSLNKLLLNSGYAWHFVKYSSRRDYAELETAARKAKKGLWADARPIPPWEWRKGKR